MLMLESKVQTITGALLNLEALATVSTARSIQKFVTIWNAPWLSDFAKISFSSRLSRSLGRCKPASGEIHLNSQLLDHTLQSLLDEVVCHEAAHVLNFAQHGRLAKPHGPEWRALVSTAGFHLRRSTHSPEIKASTVVPRNQSVYEHRCPVCQATRYSVKPI